MTTMLGVRMTIDRREGMYSSWEILTQTTQKGKVHREEDGRRLRFTWLEFIGQLDRQAESGNVRKEGDIDTNQLRLRTSWEMAGV